MWTHNVHEKITHGQFELNVNVNALFVARLK